MQATITRINVYRADGEWCYAAWADEGFDHSDPLGIADSEPEVVAMAEARRQFPGAEVHRVDDV